MTSNKKTKRSQLAVNYQVSENTDGFEMLYNAFDILFEEVLKQNEELTTNDN